MGLNSALIALGAGEILIQRRGVALDTVQVKAASTPTTTIFTATAVEAAKVRVGDILAPAAGTPTNLAPEASTNPRITAINVNGADFDIVVSPAFSVAPAASAQLKILWKDLGGTTGGITMETTVNVEQIFVDQSVDPVAAILTGRETLIKAPLAENSLYNVAAGFGVAPSAVSGVLQIGATATLREDRLLLVLPGPNATKRYMVVNRVINEGTTTLTAAKDAQSIVELSLRAYIDTAMTPALLDIKDV